MAKKQGFINGCWTYKTQISQVLLGAKSEYVIGLKIIKKKKNRSKC